MNKIVLFLLVIFIFSSCSTTKRKQVTDNSLFEILDFENDGGATIQFYEILTEPEELQILLSDVKLKKKIKAQDIKTSNFVILNMGSVPAGNYKITVEDAMETADSIFIRVKEIKPTTVITPNEEEVTPYCVVKINSKKPISFR